MLEAIVLLGLAALGGLTIAAIRLGGAPFPPMWLALIHGAVAATGVGVLIYFALTSGIPTLAMAALVIFILAALGGATLFLGFHLRNKPLPIPFVIGHGLIAATGFVLLLWSWMNAA
jgi:hypothetical protein